MNIKYRPLTLSNCDKINEIDASQYIKRAWRDVDGVKQLVDINYQETELPNGYENHLAHLKHTISSGGFAIGAFRERKPAAVGESTLAEVGDSRLVAFGTLNNDLFGKESKYLLLDQLFVSKELRGQGVGSALMCFIASEAKARGSDKLYICAASSEDTIAFYRAFGCEAAKEINRELYEQDTRDIQLEYDLARLVKV